MIDQSENNDAPPVPLTDTIATQALVIVDDTTWIWSVCESAIKEQHKNVLKLASNTNIRHSWNRFHNTPFVVLHWENKLRSGGAIVEEILEIDQRHDVASKLIILTTNPIHEDVVYFSELGLKRIIKLRQRDRDLAVAYQEIQAHVQDCINPQSKPTVDSLWRKILIALDKCGDSPPLTLLEKIEQNILKLRDQSKGITAREMEAMASIHLKRRQFDSAIRMLNEAIQINPNYFRSWNTLIDLKRAQGEHAEAYALLQKMQMHNRGSVRRLIAMGETQLALKDMRKAEHYFKSALDKDGWSSRALNGLAEVKFDQEDLDEARQLIAKSTLAYQFAAKLNLKGIELVRSGSYDKALEHYSKAQYVLPQQEKGPQLLYNIALCYAKWGRINMAEEFLKLAIIKEPNYKKAQRLLEQLQAKPGFPATHDVDAA